MKELLGKIQNKSVTSSSPDLYIRNNILKQKKHLT